jgi:hypothetical protein
MKNKSPSHSSRTPAKPSPRRRIVEGNGEKQKMNLLRDAFYSTIKNQQSTINKNPSNSNKTRTADTSTCTCSRAAEPNS